MAELLKNIPTNLTEYPNSFKRQGAFPLEAYSVFYTMEAAEAYATSNPISYVGQTLAVVTSHVEVIEEVETSVVDDVTFYIIADAAGTLQEVGKATNGDGNTITLTDGVLSLNGFDAAPNATLPQKSPVYKKDEEGNDTDVVDHYELKWVAIDAIVEGDTNTKTVVAAGDEETHVLIETIRDEDNDTNTYKISLDLSAYATSAAVGDAIDAAKEEIQGKIDTLDAKIGVEAKAESAEGAGDAVEATGLYKAIEEAEARAKAYADANDADTAYDDTAVKADIKAVGDRVTTIENTIGDEATDGTILKKLADNAKAISDEIARADAAEKKALEDAKAYTDDEIDGISVEIAQKDGVEYIIVKNKAGNEIASANASKFVQDSFLDDVAYDAESGKITFTWTMGDGSTKTDEVAVADFVQTYTAGNGIKVENNEFSIDEAIVATKADVEALADVVDTKQTAEQVATAIAAAGHATTVYVDDELAKKADKAAYDKFVEDYATDKATFAVKSEVETALGNKVDSTTYANDMAKVAKTETVDSQFTTVGQRIDAIVEEIGAKAEGETPATGIYKEIADVAADAETKYATKEELAPVTQTANNASTAVTNLEARFDEIVAVGGEPNAINKIQVNGEELGITNKTVNISVPVIADTKVTDLNDGQALVDRVSTAESTLKSLGTTVDGHATGITTLTNRITALETEVKIEGESRIDALESAVNGVDGVSDGLVSKVATLAADVAGLKTVDTEIRATLDTKANASTVYTKDETTAAITKAIGEIPAVDLTPYAKQADLITLTTTVNEGLAARVTTADFNEFKTANDAAINAKADAANVYTKDAADAKFMTQDQVDARLNTLIDGANSEDTITNVTNLIEFVNDNAGDIAQLVTDVAANKTATETNASAIAANDAAIKKNASDIATLTTAVNNGLAGATVHESTEISVAARAGEGQSGVELGIKEVNVSKLVQTEGDVLILNGGTASI